MNRIAIAATSLAFFVLLGFSSGLCAGAEPGFKESIERLKLLYTPAAQPEGQAPAPVPVTIDSAADGTLIITRRTQLDRSQYSFTSATEQTWRVHPADLDRKRVAAQSEPVGVFVPVKKNVKRVAVERSETKTRHASPTAPGEQWYDHQQFTASFLVFPATTPQQADEAAALIKQIIKTAPNTK